MRKVLVAVILSILSGACSAVQQSYSCPVVEHKPVDSSYFRLLWSRPGITVYPDQFTPLMQGIASKLFVVTGKDIEYGGSKILALDVQSGNVLWQRDVVLPTSIITSDSQLYVGLYDKIDVVDPHTGNSVKEIDVSKVGFIYNFYATERNLYASTKSGRWLNFNIDDGTYNLSEPFLPYVPFLIENKILYFSEAGTYKAKDTETQSIHWEYPLNETVHVHPLITDTMIIILGQSGSIYGLDKIIGNLLWKVDADAISNVAVDGTQIYFLTTDGYLKVLDMNNGQEIAKLEFAPASFEPNSSPSGNIIGAYNLWVDSQRDVVVVSFGDSCQLIALKVAPE